MNTTTEISSAHTEKGEPMAEYIEVGKAKRFFNNIDSGRRGWCSTLLTPTEFAEYLDEIETADVAPVVHGRWEWMGPYRYNNYGMIGTCSVCKERLRLFAHNYCPNCGAKMDL